MPLSLSEQRMWVLRRRADERHACEAVRFMLAAAAGFRRQIAKAANLHVPTFLHEWKRLTKGAAN